jgi:hypothetical protein
VLFVAGVGKLYHYGDRHPLNSPWSLTSHSFTNLSIAKSPQPNGFEASRNWSKEELQRFNTTMRQSLANEAIRRALITYLVAVKAKDDKKDPIASVKQILATDASISALATCAIEQDGDFIYLDGWKCNTKTGEIEIHLTSKFHVVSFFGSVTRMPSREYGVEITRIIHGKRMPK